MDKQISIPLPALIHRIGREAANKAQAVAKQYGCELKRVRRSRNWRLRGDAIDIQSLASQLHVSECAEISYLVQKITTALQQHADKLEPLQVKLARLIKGNPSITLNELMHLTQCSLTAARRARFDADAW